MIDRDDLFRRYAATNPVPSDAVLPDEVVDGRPPLSLLIQGCEADGAGFVVPRGSSAVRRWRGPVVAAAVVAVVLLVVLPLAMLTGGGRSVEDDVATVQIPGAWSPVLSLTVARPVETPFVCPETAEPDSPGSDGQPRPDSGLWSNQAAAFDLRAGRVVHVDQARETWTFDVCTNTWQQMNPAFVSSDIGQQRSAYSGPGLLGGELVYDADSDRTVAFGAETVAVYDAGANTWTYRDVPAEYRGQGSAGAVYDPISGWVIAQIPERGVVAYDVDTDTWTDVGTLRCSQRMIYDPATEQWSPAEPEPCYPFLIGYSADVDRLILVGYQGGGQLVDPRTGTSTYLDGPPSGGPEPFGVFDYANGADTAYTFGVDICRLNATTHSWACTNFPDEPSIDHYDGFSARVRDPVNNRIVLIDGYCCGGFSTDLPERHSNDVWAIDPVTGALVELLTSAEQ